MQIRKATVSPQLFTLEELVHIGNEESISRALRNLGIMYETLSMAVSSKTRGVTREEIRAKIGCYRSIKFRINGTLMPSPSKEGKTRCSVLKSATATPPSA